MEIFDNGYLTEEEKNALDTQDLIDLAISNYTGAPLKSILPRYLYKYELDQEGKIHRTSYFNDKAAEYNDVLWDTFINVRNPGNPFSILRYEYKAVQYMDDQGTVYDIEPEDQMMQYLQLDFAGRTKPYKYIRPIERNTAYFLRWVDDREFLETLEKFE